MNWSDITGTFSKVKVPKSWAPIFYVFLNDPYIKKNFQDLEAAIEDAKARNKKVYPPKELIWNAFKLCPFSKVRVVIIGQDVYHSQPRQAMGLSFSVPRDVGIPPSLRNIFKELNNSCNVIRKHGDLSDWARQGVLLLNCALTVEEKKAGSHMKYWKLFSTAIVSYLSDASKHRIIFVGWGRFARGMIDKIVDREKHIVLESQHPSPLASGKGPDAFLGCDHFKKINELLGMDQIKW